MNLKRVLVVIAVVAIVCLTGAPARADTFVAATDLGCTVPAAGSVTNCGFSQKDLGWTTIDANNDGTDRNLALKNSGGVIGVGVKDGHVNGEIDTDDSEEIKFVFDAPQQISQFTLAFLYGPGDYGCFLWWCGYGEGPAGDTVWEMARVRDLDSNPLGTLQVSYSAASNTANWSFGIGTVTNLSPSTSTGLGEYRVDNPFGSASVGGLIFAPVNSSDASGSHDSDFSIVSLATVTQVPEPTSILLLGTCMLGAGALIRRRLRG